MYICKDCGQTFTDLFYIGKDNDAGEEPIFACPFCHKMSYSEAVWCDVCECWKDPELIKVNDGICEDCMEHYYSAYVGVNWLMTSEKRMHEFMRWQGIPLILEDAFYESLKHIRTAEWDACERDYIIKQIREYFFCDRDWLATMLHRMINSYDYGRFSSHFSTKKFLRFLSLNWDASYPVCDWFAAYFYGLDKIDNIMIKSLLLYIQTQLDAAEKGTTAARAEVTRCTKIMTDFVRAHPYVGIAYCIYCEED